MKKKVESGWRSIIGSQRVPSCISQPTTLRRYVVSAAWRQTILCERALCQQVSGRKEKGWQWHFQVRKLENPSAKKKDEKSIRQIRSIIITLIYHSDLNSGMIRVFAIGSRYMIYLDPSHPGYLTQVLVDTGANCNTISRTLFEKLIDRGLV